jgi:PAS domain S-box-containing protein
MHRMHRRGGPTARLSAATIVLTYVISAVVWIALSDGVLGALINDPGTLVTVSTLKGWAFVAVTGAMLAILLHRYDVQRAGQTAELKARENRFRLLAEHAQDVISRYRVHPTPAFDYVSPSVEAVLGYTPGAFYADPGLMTRLVHPDDRHLLEPESGAPQVADTVVMRLQHAAGHWVWLEQRNTPVLDSEGRLVAVEGAARDVSDRQRAEAHLARLNRVLRTLTAANAALVRAGSEVELLDAICRVIVEEGPYRYAWVGYREDDEAGTIRPMASAGYEADDEVGLDVTWHPTERGMGPVGTSVREGRTVTLPDVTTDPSFAPWREVARARGYVSGAAIPLRDGSRAFGTLVIYSDERDAFRAEEIVLLEDLAEGLAYGVGTFRAHAAREAGEAREGRRSRERALIADALGALRPLDTAEQTAEAICRRVVELPEIAMASLLLLEPDGTAIPVAMTVDDGRVLERKSLGPERSMQLRTRAAQGPWVEAWEPRVGHPFLDDHLAIGLRGQAYSPVRSGATLIGLLTVGSRDPDAVALLTERLPAILEFASLAGALLAPSFALTSVTAAARVTIQAVIDDEAFHPVFQPIVDLASRGVVGYEALTRFADGTSPDLVFAEAQRCGLKGELESATMRAAIAAAELLPRGHFLSLNVSPALILAGDELRAILAARTRPIVLEITEHDTIEDYAALRSAFVALGSGLRLAVDDAGAGVANFNHLVELRPQFVKVDIGLVRGVNADLARQALIVALLHFAGATDCHVVAEGIETEAERAVLEKLEIPFGQGYLFGRPAVASTWVASADEPPSMPRRKESLRAISGGRDPGA